jgi:hypothetical protein
VTENGHDHLRGRASLRKQAPRGHPQAMRFSIKG